MRPGPAREGGMRASHVERQRDDAGVDRHDLDGLHGDESAPERLNRASPERCRTTGIVVDQRIEVAKELFQCVPAGSGKQPLHVTVGEFAPSMRQCSRWSPHAAARKAAPERALRLCSRWVDCGGNGREQRLEFLLQREPHNAFQHIVIIVPVDIPYELPGEHDVVANVEQCVGRSCQKA